MTELRWAALVFTILLCCARLSGDEPKQPKPSVPLPRHYGKLGLDKEQLDKVRKARTKFRAQIEELRHRLRALEKQEDAELQKFLTDAQRASLKDLRAQGPGTFKISAPERPIKVQQGKSTTFAVELSHDKAFDGEVTLTFDNLPKGMRVRPSPFVFKDGDDPIGQLTIRTDKSVDTRDYSFTIRATPDQGEPVEVTVRVLVTF
jgi:hypothetical protein